MARLGGMLRGRKDVNDPNLAKNEADSSSSKHVERTVNDKGDARIRLARPYILAMTVIVSIGGFIFGKWTESSHLCRRNGTEHICLVQRTLFRPVWLKDTLLTRPIRI
jgi:hypothetical protein